MSLKVSNDIPRADIRLHTNGDEKSCLLVLRDSFTAINTVNQLLYQWTITQHLHMVEPYEHFDNHDSFEHIKVSCAVDNDNFKTLI